MTWRIMIITMLQIMRVCPDLDDEQDAYGEAVDDPPT